MKPPPDRAGYAFGHSDAAAARLQLVDEVFAGPTRQLLAAVAGEPVGLAVDLGCGPGFSTLRLGDAVRPARLAGLDVSDAFLERARSLNPDASWYRHDVSVVPFPTGPADVLHARFVLSHLADPEAVVVSWLGQLSSGGYLLLMEDEEIVADHPVLAAYEEMARTLVTHRGGDLWVGARLSRVEAPAGYRQLTNRVGRHEVPVPLAARMYAMNFAVWRQDEFILGNHAAPQLDELAADLTRLAGSREPGQVVFDIRHVAYRRE